MAVFNYIVHSIRTLVLANFSSARVRSRLFFTIKLIITIALCLLLFRDFDRSRFLEGIDDWNLLLIPVLFLLMFLGITISAYKWQLMLAIHGINFGFARLQRYYLIAKFLGNFLPTNIGGDGYRVYKTLRNNRSKAGAVLAVLGERVTGIMALMILGFAAAVYNYFRNGDILSQWVALGGTIACAVSVFGIYLVRKFSLFDWIASRRPFAGLLHHIPEYTRDYRENVPTGIWVIAVSFAFHTYSLILHGLLLRTVGAECAASNLLVVLTVVTLVGTLPITLNGIGSVDISFVYLLGLYDVRYETALSAILLLRTLNLLMSLVGGYYNMVEKAENPAKSNGGATQPLS